MPETPAAPVPETPASPAALAGLPSGTSQAVVVVAPSAGGTTATVTGWERRGAEWVAALGPYAAHLGREGIGASSESAARTPQGTFGITRAFGRAPDPGTALPYDRVGPDDWWVSDPASPRYNTPQTCAPGSCPFDEDASENLHAAGPAYDHAIVIDANTAPVRPDGGSAYFLRWLRPDARIAIGL